MVPQGRLMLESEQLIHDFQQKVVAALDNSRMVPQGRLMLESEQLIHDFQLKVVAALDGERKRRGREAAAL